eukprot:jgi/Mesvir1/19604/Mv09901-RA.1
MTALHLACSRQDTDLVKLLIDAGADVNIRDKDGRTPLFSACKNIQLDMTSILIKAGADASAKDKAGNTAIMELARTFASFVYSTKPSYPAIFAQLVSAGAIGQDGNKLMETLLLFKDGREWGANQKNYREPRKTLCAAMIKSLLQGGVDPTGKASAVHWSRTVIELIASEDCAAVPVSAVQDIVSVQAYWQADFYSWAFFYSKENACLQRVRGPAKMKELKARPFRRTTSILKRFKAESDGTTLKAVFESPTHDAAKPLAEVLGRLWWVLRYGGDGHVELQREITID